MMRIDSLLQRGWISRTLVLAALGSTACNDYEGTKRWPNVYPPEDEIDRPKGGTMDAASRDAGSDSGNADAGVLAGGADAGVTLDASASDAALDAQPSGDGALGATPAAEGAAEAAAPSDAAPEAS